MNVSWEAGPAVMDLGPWGSREEEVIPVTNNPGTRKTGTSGHAHQPCARTNQAGARGNQAGARGNRAGARGNRAGARGNRAGARGK